MIRPTSASKPGRGLVSAALAVLLLAACSSSDVTLQSRPSDADSARDLAELVAEKAECGSVEYYNDAADRWTFTCQSGDGSYQITVVRDEGAKQAALDELGTSPPVKTGAYFLVQAATDANGTAAGDLERFPGEVAGSGSG